MQRVHIIFMSSDLVSAPAVSAISKPRVPRPAPASPLLAYPLDACDAAPRIPRRPSRLRGSRAHRRTWVARCRAARPPLRQHPHLRGEPPGSRPTPSSLDAPSTPTLGLEPTIWMLELAAWMIPLDAWPGLNRPAEAAEPSTPTRQCSTPWRSVQ